MPGIEFTKERTAKVFGCDPRTIERWVRDGCPVSSNGEGRRRFNSAAVVAWLKQRERESVLVKQNAVRERREKVLLELREFELAQKRGQVITLEDATRVMFKTCRTVRDSILNVPARLCDQIAAEKMDAGRVHELLTNELRAALSSLADRLEKGEVGDDAR